ncbi:ATP-binding protein [Streptomyces sp. JJ66]|uniref:ATP-binding protein n=1 Tax=Streptomyces sp. JJ66 TaxID=2803843 RepID=UPI001C59425C|nr:ATP-binding protein [Streptomyces sp. JJ66]MBW1603684.1 ATP-binding protein [Streptomyces sp. JJ66]
MHSRTSPRSGADHAFLLLLSSTRRGARLARLLAVEQLRTWRVPPSVTERAEHVVAELAANAISHGRVAGRDFRLGLRLIPQTGTVRIEVTDANGARVPVPASAPGQDGAPGAESGRGLLLVSALADRWGTEPYPPSGKTVWAECAAKPH